MERKMMMENYVKIANNNNEMMMSGSHYPFFSVQARQMYHNLNQEVQLGKNGSCPLNRAFLYRQMMQNQWNTIQ